MRKLIGLTVAALLLCLPGMSEAQDFIRYYPPAGLASSGGTLTGPLLIPLSETPARDFITVSVTDGALPRNIFRVGSTGGVRVWDWFGVWPVASDSFGSLDAAMAFFYSDLNAAGTTLKVMNNSNAHSIAKFYKYTGAGPTGTPVFEINNADTRALAPFKFMTLCTGTDCATAYEGLRVHSFGGAIYVETESSGTGVGRAIVFNSSAGNIAVSGGTNFYPATTDTAILGYPASNLWQTLYLSRSIQGSKSKALTGGSATTFLRVAVPQTAAANYGGGSVGYTVYATDGTDSQSLVGDVRFAMLNKAGTETCTIGEVGTPVLAESAGGSTLSCTFTCATAAADTVDLAANCASSLVETTFTIEYRGDMQKTNTYTPQ